ncbi:MAG: energy-coupling factor transporter transmembrane protein EcfT, partial [Anaerofustis stercorihominis]|nr:energy-coupling factor transporter transmembrane protein EcfT [Anaerofustis stercorihominis]
MKFDSYHPTINLIYFTAVILFSISFRHPVFLAVSFVCAFMYSVKLNGMKALVFNICLVPLIVIYAFWYSYYNHFGMTYISQNFTGNNITLESLIYGFVLGVMMASVVMWFSCVYAVVSTDKIIYLFGRISPKLSLFISIILRTVPRVKARAKKINLAQQAIGRGFNQGNIINRIVNFVRQ